MVSVAILTYHEITLDARIYKQAKCLAKCGYKVTVHCLHIDGYIEEESMDGFQVKRFKCFKHETVIKYDFSIYCFLDKSRKPIQVLYTQYQEAVKNFYNKKNNQLISKFRNKWIISREQLNRTNDFPNIVKRFNHIFVSLQFGLFKLLYSNKHQSYKEDQEKLSESFRALYQASGLVYAVNLLQTDLTKYDVVHAHDLYTLPAALMLKKEQGCCVIYDAHEYEPARISDCPQNMRSTIDAFEADCLKHIDRLITVSNSIAKLYADRCSDLHPVVIMNTPEKYESEIHNQRCHFIRDKAGVSRNTPLLVFTGGVSGKSRGLDQVLYSLRYMPDCHLAVMGPRHKKNDAWLLGVAKEAGVRHRVSLVDPVEAHRVSESIESANLAIIPIQDHSLSYRYCMPNKLFEAAFARIPICVSDLPEMRAFVEELGIGRTMDQTDPKSIADAIRDVLENPEKYRYTQETERLLEEKYSWEAQCKKLTELYDNIECSSAVGSP